MSKPKLTDQDFCRASLRLKCEVAAIKAVSEVESRGNGFYADGFPVILFERHKFRSFTDGDYNSSHPQISGPAGGYGSAGQNQKNKFNIAFKLDPEAAMKSCSWGKFQIMGFNHKLCGFSTVGAFVDAMKESEGRQLDAFVEFVRNTGLADELRNREWADFARGYNGADYRKNKYDTKMAAEYKKFAKEDIDCSQVSAVSQPAIDSSPARPTEVRIVDQTDTPASEEIPPTPEKEWTEGERPEANVQIDNAQNVNVEPQKPKPQNGSVKVTVERTSIWAKIGLITAAITGFGINLGNVITTKLSEMTPIQFGYAIGGAIIVGVGLWLFDRAAKRAHEKTLAKMATASDPSQNTIELREQVKK